MNFQHLTDQSLEQELQNSVREENKLKTHILHLLSEFEKRRLFSKSHPSLFEYCVKTLKYSASAAQRRIDSMRAIKVMPEIEEKILTGELNLSTISQAQTFFRQEKKTGKTYNVEAKRQILQMLEGKSARECEKELVKISPSALPREGRRELTEDLTEVKMVLNRKQIEKLEKVKQFLSHKFPHLTDSELIETLADIAIKKLDPSSKTPSVSRVLPTSVVHGTKIEMALEGADSIRPAKPAQSRTRFIPAQIRRAVWIRDGGKCTQLGCNSKHFLEIDHRIPVARGGGAELENLRLLCRTHNTRAAIGVFGKTKIEPYLRH